VQLVIADTSPVNYLILIGHIELLPALFEKVILPSAVRDELAILTRLRGCDFGSLIRPLGQVRHAATQLSDVVVAGLGPGETAAITLAVEIQAPISSLWTIGAA
jgi:predicted nucleic acid-binding protein